MTGLSPKMQAVVDERLRGTSQPEIAAMMGIKTETVRYYLSCARQMGVEVPRDTRRGPRAKGHLLALSARLCDALRPHALVRGVSIEMLADRILCQVALPKEGDELVDAVLDDLEDVDV